MTKVKSIVRTLVFITMLMGIGMLLSTLLVTFAAVAFPPALPLEPAQIAESAVVVRWLGGIGTGVASLCWFIFWLSEPDKEER